MPRLPQVASRVLLPSSLSVLLNSEDPARTDVDNGTGGGIEDERENDDDKEETKAVDETKD